MTREHSMWGSSTGMVVRRIHILSRDVYRDLLAQLKPLGLSMQQAVTVCYLYEHTEEPVYQKSIERELGLKNPTVTAMVQSMMKNDVVYRIRDKHDGRLYQLKLTPHGQKLYEPARKVLMDTSAKYEARLTPEELEEFYRLVSKLLQDDAAEEQRAERG